MKLRKYQSEMIDSVKASVINGNKKVMLSLPTGAGKSVCAYELVRLANAKKNNVLFLAHRVLLIKQMKNTLSGFDNVIVETLQATKNREHDDIKVIIFDEAHWSANSNLQKQVMAKYPKAITIGMSATPLTARGHKLESWNTTISTVQTSDLVEQGFLSPFRVLAPVGVDSDDFRVTAGEYNAKDVSEEVTKNVIVKGIVEKYAKYAEGLRTLIFCVNVEHSELIAKEFREKGYRAEHYHSKMSKADRLDVFERFKNGELDILANIDTLTTGVDLPDIYCGLFATPTKSIVKAIQCYGRICRLNPKDPNKTALILDCANVIKDTVHPLDRLDFDRVPDNSNNKCDCGGTMRIIKMAVVESLESPGIFIKIVTKECIDCKNKEVAETEIVDNLIFCEECENEIKKGESETKTIIKDGAVELFSVCPHCKAEIPLRSIKAIDTELEEVSAKINMNRCETWDDVEDQLKKAKSKDGKRYHNRWCKIVTNSLQAENFTIDEVTQFVKFYEKKGWAIGGIVKAMKKRRGDMV